METAIHGRTTGIAPSVLILDDEQPIISSLVSLLRRLRYKVHPFEDGASALEFIANNAVDVVLTDMKMPTMSGSEFLEKLATVSPDCVKIMMSGYENKDIIVGAIDRGLAQYYIFKPWDDALLRSTIAEAVRMREEMKKHHLKESLVSLSTLPAPPKFQAGLWELLSNPDKPIKEIAAEIEHSPALVAKLLRVANSVFFGTRQNIGTVDDALKLIGTQYVVSMAVSIEAFGAASTNGSALIAEAVNSIWETSVRRANIAKSIGAKWNPPLPMQTLHIATLLQDIGLVVRACAMSDDFLMFQQMIENTTIDPYQAEHDIFGSTHDMIGEIVLEYWHFPESICSLVGRHHAPAGDEPMITVMQMATLINDENDRYPRDEQVFQLAAEWKERQLEKA